jgi:uncharacterized protein
MALLRCPTCKRQFEQQESRAMPFCSVRCRSIDLNRWLSEDIRIPIEDETGDGENAERPDDAD